MPPTPPLTSISSSLSDNYLTFDFNQQPVRYLTLERVGNCSAPLTVEARASDFQNNFTEITFWQDPTSVNCTPWLIPDLDPALPYDQVRVSGEGVVNGTLYLSLRGFMRTP